MTSLCVVLASQAARAQCDPHWAPGFNQVDFNIPVTAMCRHGNGIVLGTTTDLGSASVDTWSDNQHLIIGSVTNNPFGSSPEVHDLLEFDFGSGTEVVAAGLFDHVANVPAADVARWNGSTWTALDAGLEDNWDVPVLALCAFDDGTGVHLFAGGNFSVPGGHGIARWSGTTWEPVGGAQLPAVSDLCVHDDGSGPALYIAGGFTQVAGVSARGIARWNGTAWSAVGTVGTQTPGINSMTVHNGALYVCGALAGLSVGSDTIARWDGSAWTGITAGTTSPVFSLTSHDDGTGAALYAFGAFTQIGGVSASRVARWDGASWSALGTGVNDYAWRGLSWNDGSGPALAVGGYFDAAGGITTTHAAQWKSGAWKRLSDDVGFDQVVNALYVHDDGSGPKLFAGGRFTRAGDTSAACIARLDGSTWSALGSGLGGSSFSAVSSLVTFDDGQGPKLYAGGNFTLAGGVSANGIARWDGTAWSALPGGDLGVGGAIGALCVHDDGSGPALYAGGTFDHIGGVTTHGIARWNGASWSALGTGTSANGPSGGSARVVALASHDDGHGPALFVGGDFLNAGGMPGTRDLAAWRNGAWEPLGGATFGGAVRMVRCLAVLDDGAGPRLWLGGDFESLGGYYAKGIGTWDGTRFWPVGAGFPDGLNAAFPVYALGSFDDGPAHGRRIFAGGGMQDVGGSTSDDIAAWNGTSWEAVDGGTSNLVLAFAEQNDGSGSKLWAGGGFSLAGTTPSRAIARLDPTCHAAVTFCSGDGSGTACPCGNSGASGNGCASSFAPLGAHLLASGVPSVSSDSITLTVTDISPAPVTFFQGTARVNNGAGAVFGDGLRCAGGTTIRFAAQPSSAGSAHYPGASTPTVSVSGQVPPTGGTRTYQAWYRNAGAFCTSSTFNLSNGVEIQWAP